MSPLTEVGAGTGYWALQLSHMGVEVTALDSQPPGSRSRNLWHRGVPAMTEACTDPAADSLHLPACSLRV